MRESMCKIDIQGLDKSEVLLALYNDSHPQGLSVLGLPGRVIDLDDCRRALEGRTRLTFDYWNGHILKVDLTGDSFDPDLYDRDCGEGAAQAAISRLRAAT
jgi:hypothetical protein